MRIEPKGGVLAISLEPRETSAQAGAKPAEAASVVKLSAAGAMVTALPKASTTQRLERIRELLDKGEYPVDLDTLADHIVDDEVLRGG
jgi:anti-sigma28 factor (negative regulator of flagellin synthesis)